MLLVSANQGRCRYGRQTNADVFGQKQKQKMFLSHRKQIALCFFLSAEGGFYGVGSYFRMGPAGPLLAECSPHVMHMSLKRVNDIFPNLFHIIEFHFDLCKTLGISLTSLLLNQLYIHPSTLFSEGNLREWQLHAVIVFVCLCV